MFTLPPRLPKDYVIKDVTNSLKSSSQFTPDSLPRVTQSNLAKYCYPVEYRDDEVPEHKIVDIEPSILNKMTNDARALWLPAPGKEAFTLHEVYRKYSNPPDNYDTRFRNGEKVFNRSYQYELECLEVIRQEKIKAKSLNDRAIFEKSYQDKVDLSASTQAPNSVLNRCEHKPPFWWKENDYNGKSIDAPDLKEDLPTKMECFECGTSRLRWQEEPNLTGFVKDDPCKRKREMRLGKYYYLGTFRLEQLAMKLLK